MIESEPDRPVRPVGWVQLACMAAILVAVAARLPAQRLIFLGDRIDDLLTDGPGGRVVVFAALAGLVLAAGQLAALRRPAPGGFRQWAAAAVAVAGLFLGIGVAALGVRLGYRPDIPADWSPVPGLGAVVTVLSGVAFAGCAGVRLVGLVGRRPGWGRRAGTGVVLVLAGLPLGYWAWAAWTGPRPVTGLDEALARPDPRQEVKELPAGMVAAELERLRGEWKLLLSKPPDGREGERITFDGPRVTMTGWHPDPLRVRMDPYEIPGWIDLIGRADGMEFRIPGTYLLDGDRLALYMGTKVEAGRPAERPSALEDKPCQVWYFERVRPADGRGP